MAAATKLPDTMTKSLSETQKEGGWEGYRGVGMGVVVKNIEREEDKGWGSAIGEETRVDKQLSDWVTHRLIFY